MAAIKEILDFESARSGADMLRSVHLFQEGSFYRAYEWSAWLMCSYIHDFKPTHRHMKGIDQSVVLIGFPVTSLGKWTDNIANRHDVGDKHLLLRIADDKFTSVENESEMLDAFQRWKSQLPIVDKSDRHSPQELGLSSPVMNLTSIAQRILAFPIESKSLIECAQFLSDIKQQLAKLY